MRLKTLILSRAIFGFRSLASGHWFLNGFLNGFLNAGLWSLGFDAPSRQMLKGFGVRTGNTLV